MEPVDITHKIKENHFTRSPTTKVQHISAFNGSIEEMATKSLLENCDGPEEDSVLQKFYSGTTVFITGATGSMGKVLLEKLMRSCPNISRIFMLIRDKKGRTPTERIDDLLKVPCFDRVRDLPDNPASKLQAISGDVGTEGLGLSAEDFAMLTANVDVIFHFAATVRFDEKLRTAITQNVRGTRDLLALCHACANLKAVIHVSTAYSNCPSKNIEEKFYPAPLSSEMAIRLAEELDVDALEKLTPGLIGEWPNTYAYTKLLSEDACHRYGKGLPLAVFRPAIVVATATEPMPGWIDNLYGPTGVIAGSATGLLHTMQLAQEASATIVPCDMAINGILAAAWDVASSRKIDNPAPVYNYSTSSENPLTWGQFGDLYYKRNQVHPSNKAIWHQFILFTTHRKSTFIYRLFLHFFPACVIDLLMLVTGRKPFMVAAYRKIHRFLEVITYFNNQQWTFGDDNVVSLWNKLGAKDRELFQFDMRHLNWNEYVVNSAIGIRRYLVKEDDSTIGPALKRCTRLKWLHWATVFLLGLLIVWSLYSVGLFRSYVQALRF